MELGDFSPNLYMVNYNIPCFVHKSRILKERTCRVCVMVKLRVCIGKLIRPTYLKSDNDYPDLSFPFLSADLFKFLLNQLFASNPSN